MRPGSCVVAVAAVALCASGCGGYYILSVPDHVAPIDSEATVVTRLCRNDFFVLEPAVREALLRFRIGNGPMRAAYTDRLGYAAARVPTPSAPGRYRLYVAHMDREGEEVFGGAYVYAWQPRRALLAVELESLPRVGQAGLPAARRFLNHFAREGNVLYLTQQSLEKHDLVHGQIMTCEYPDGPVLFWRHRRWRVTTSSRMPYVTLESQLVSQLAEVKQLFPGLRSGLCTSVLAEKAFAEAGLVTSVVGRLPNSLRAKWYESWDALPVGGS